MQTRLLKPLFFHLRPDGFENNQTKMNRMTKGIELNTFNLYGLFNYQQ